MTSIGLYADQINAAGRHLTIDLGSRLAGGCALPIDGHEGMHRRADMRPRRSILDR